MSASCRAETVYYLQPGECLVTSEPARVVTVLGSCVAVTLFDPVSGLSAMFHAVLPSRRRFPVRAPGPDSAFRYVDEGLARLLDRLDRAGAPRARLVAKVFGGAEALAPGQAVQRGLAVGRLNVKAAFDALQRQGLAVNNSDVGGRRGRTVVFSTRTGEVLLKRQAGNEAGKPQGGVRP